MHKQITRAQKTPNCVYMCNYIVHIDTITLDELIRMDLYRNTVRPLIWVYHVMDFLNGYMNEGNAQVTNLKLSKFRIHKLLITKRYL